MPELKNVSREERTLLLKGAHDVLVEKVRGRKILLFDDLFQSGSTMSAICQALLDAGSKKVFALTLTRRRPPYERCHCQARNGTCCKKFRYS